MTMVVKVGYVQGTCPRCGRTLTRRRPADVAVCDCWEYCPKGHKMQPYIPDLTPQTYKSREGTEAWGDTEHPMYIVRYCPICNYYSAQKPVEVKLS